MYDIETSFFKQFQTSTSIKSIQCEQRHQSGTLITDLNEDTLMLKNQLGRNQNRSVWKAQDELGLSVAIKIIDRNNLSQNQIKHLNNEITALSMLQSPFLIKMNQIFQKNNFCYIVSQYLQKGSLANYHPIYTPKIQDFKSRIYSARFLIAEIFLAMMDIHQQGYIYQDLKPQNILIDNQNHIKLCDFGLVCPSGTIQPSLSGTIQYMAPQRLTNARTNNPLEPSSDMWSLGITIYQILRGEVPYVSDDPAGIIDEIYEAQPYFEADFPKQAKSLILGLLQANPRRRTNQQQFMNHAYFQRECPFDWNQVRKKENILQYMSKVKRRSE